MTMRRLLSLLILLFALPASASLFDSRPSPTLGGLNNSADFLPVREAFRLSLVDANSERRLLPVSPSLSVQGRRPQRDYRRGTAPSRRKED
jgi:hypothetical protein